MSKPVLDASVVLAFLQGEALNARARAAIRPGARIGAVNLCEVYGKLLDRGVTADDAQTAVAKLRLDVVPFDETLADRAARLRTIVPRHLSLGDRACLALATARGAKVFTCDREWLALDIEAEVALAR